MTILRSREAIMDFTRMSKRELDDAVAHGMPVACIRGRLYADTSQLREWFIVKSLNAAKRRRFVKNKTLNAKDKRIYIRRKGLARTLAHTAILHLHPDFTFHAQET